MEFFKRDLRNFFFRGNFNSLLALKLEIKHAIAKSRPILDLLQTHKQRCCYCEVKSVQGNLYRCLQCDQVKILSLWILRIEILLF